MKKKKKHCFLLIEILIAIALIGLCSTALVMPSYTISAKKMELIETMQLNHFSTESYLNLKMLVLEKKVALPLKNDGFIRGELPPVKVMLPSGDTLPYRCSYHLKRSKSTKGTGLKAYLFTM